MSIEPSEVVQNQSTVMSPNTNNNMRPMFVLPLVPPPTTTYLVHTNSSAVIPTNPSSGSVMYNPVSQQLLPLAMSYNDGIINNTAETFTYQIPTNIPYIIDIRSVGADYKNASIYMAPTTESTTTTTRTNNIWRRMCRWCNCLIDCSESIDDYEAELLFNQHETTCASNMYYYAVTKNNLSEKKP